MSANDMAFPVLDRTLTPNDTTQLGLTKREYFAAMALPVAAHYGAGSDFVAKTAVEFADALLAALEVPPKRSGNDGR